jgi:hypothetical protein
VCQAYPLPLLARSGLDNRRRTMLLHVAHHIKTSFQTSGPSVPASMSCMVGPLPLICNQMGTLPYHLGITIPGPPITTSLKPCGPAPLPEIRPIGSTLDRAGSGTDDSSGLLVCREVSRVCLGVFQGITGRGSGGFRVFPADV